jgi:hypothetical protein
VWLNNSDNFILTNPTISQLNTFTGSVTQQATSVVTSTDPACYEQDGGCFSIYGFEYKAGYNDGVSVPPVLPCLDLTGHST